MIQRVAKNTFFLFLAQVGVKVVNFFYLIFLARTLLVTGFGQYVFAVTFLYFFAALAEFGLDRLVLRDVSRFPEKKQSYLSNTLGLRLILAIIAYFLAGFSVKIFGYSQANFLNVLVIGFSLLPQTFSQAYTSLFNSQERMGFSAAINFLIAFFTAIIGFFLVKSYGLSGALIASTLGLSLAFLWVIYFGKKLKVKFIFQFDFKFWRRLLIQAWPFALLTLFALLYLRLNIVILSRLTNDYLTGLYGSVFKLVELGVVLPQALTLALFPSFSRLIIKDLGKLRKVYLQGLGFLFLISLPLFIFVALFSQSIMNLIYGGAYLKATPALFILAFSLPFFFVNALPANVILNSLKVKKFLPFEFSKIIISVTLSLILISRFSIIGAAWAVVGGEIAGLLINNWFVWKILKS